MTLQTSPLTQDALSLIVQNYNNGLAAPLQINDTDYSFDAPIVNPDLGQNRNTRLRVRPVAISGKYGRITIYYNRIDLGLIVDLPVVTLGAAVYVADIIPFINDFFGINLVPADYTNSALPASGSFNVDASVNSLMFVGSLGITIAAGSTTGIAPAVIPLALSWVGGPSVSVNTAPQVRVKGPMVASDTVVLSLAWTPGRDGTAPPTVNPVFVMDGLDRLYTVTVHNSPVDHGPYAFSSGVGILSSTLNGAASGNTLVLVVSDKSNAYGSYGFYEQVGTYITLAAAGL